MKASFLLVIGLLISLVAADVLDIEDENETKTVDALVKQADSLIAALESAETSDHKAHSSLDDASRSLLELSTEDEDEDDPISSTTQSLKSITLSEPSLRSSSSDDDDNKIRRLPTRLDAKSPAASQAPATQPPAPATQAPTEAEVEPAADADADAATGDVPAPEKKSRSDLLARAHELVRQLTQAEDDEEVAAPVSPTTAPTRRSGTTRSELLRRAHNLVASLTREHEGQTGVKARTQAPRTQAPTGTTRAELLRRAHDLVSALTREQKPRTPAPTQARATQPPAPQPKTPVSAGHVFSRHPLVNRAHNLVQELQALGKTDAAGLEKARSSSRDMLLANALARLNGLLSSHAQADDQLGALKKRVLQLEELTKKAADDQLGALKKRILQLEEQSKKPATPAIDPTLLTLLRDQISKEHKSAEKWKHLAEKRALQLAASEAQAKEKTTLYESVQGKAKHAIEVKQKLKERVEKMKARIEALEQSLAKRSKRLDRMTAEHLSLTLQSQTGASLAKILKSELVELRQETVDYKKKLAELTQKLKEEHDSKEKATQTYEADLKKKQADFDKQRNDLNSLISKNKADIQDRETKLQQLQHVLAEAEKNISSLHHVADTQTQQLKDLNSKNQQLMHDVAAWQMRTKLAQETLKNSKVNELRSQIVVLKRAVETSKTSLKQAQDQVVSLTNARDQALKDLSGLKSMSAAYQKKMDEIHKARLALVQLQSELLAKQQAADLLTVAVTDAQRAITESNDKLATLNALLAKAAPVAPAKTNTTSARPTVAATKAPLSKEALQITVQIESVKAQRKQLDQQLASVKQQAAAAQKVVSDVQNKVNTQQKTLDQLTQQARTMATSDTTKHAQLHQQIFANQQRVTALEAQLQAARRNVTSTILQMKDVQQQLPQLKALLARVVVQKQKISALASKQTELQGIIAQRDKRIQDLLAQYAKASEASFASRAHLIKEIKILKHEMSMASKTIEKIRQQEHEQHDKVKKLKAALMRAKANQPASTKKPQKK